MAGTDRVVFSVSGGGTLSAPWPGDWPPPEVLYLVSAQEGVTFVDPERQSEATMATLVEDFGAERFVRRSASEIPEPAPEDEQWFRGALYEEEARDA